MIRNLIKKYGLVPKCAMNENKQANNTAQLIALLNNALRSFAYKLREDPKHSSKGTYR